MPMAASPIPCRSTKQITSPDNAPSAINTPISCALCVTRYDITPYRLMAASNIANVTNAPSMVLAKRWRASESYTRSCIPRIP
jgi:hypothetical protein